MELSSLLFLFLFLPVFLVIYLVCTQKLKLPIILAASIIFLTWGERTALFWLTGIIIFGYLMGLVIAKTEGKRIASALLMWVAIGMILLIFSFFKIKSAYGEAGLINLHFPEDWIAPSMGLAVPVGLSYLMFQMISYLIDVRRGTIPVEKNFIKLAAYLLFFPKLVSGPLIQYKSFESQLETLNPSFDDIAMGFRRFLAGFVKRALLANQLALMADAVFNLPSANIAPRFAWLALLAYTLQIFLDFCGYTDMAIGLALMIGIRLPENFNFPYISKSISEFWRRWHITLSSWFREYVFYPLERKRFKWGGQQINIVFVFLLIGLWHGFKPTFVIWGLLHGFAVTVESLGFGRLLSKIWRPIRHLYTLMIVMAGWVFFRSDTLEFSREFFQRLAGNTAGLVLLPFSVSKPMPFIEPSFILALAVGILLSLPLFSRWNQMRAKLEAGHAYLYIFFQLMEDSILVLMFILGLAMLLSDGFIPTIYTKF